MTDTRQRPWHLWAAAALATLWNGFGCYIYFVEQTTTSQTPASLFYDAYPMWMHAVWAIAVWGALVASLLLFLRSRFAVPLFLVSLIGLIVSTVRNYGFAGGMEIGGFGFTVGLIIIALGFWLYARAMGRRGVLR